MANFTPTTVTSRQLSLLTQFFPPDYAATGQFVHSLVKYFSHQGMDVKVFTGQPGYAYDSPLAPSWELLDGVAVHRTRVARFWPQRIRGRAMGGVLFCLRSLLKLLHPSFRGELLLVTTEPPYLAILAGLINYWFGLPYLCVVYDIYPDVAVALGMMSEQHWLVRFWYWCNRQIWRRASAIVVLSDTMKKQIVERCPDVADKVTVIHSWADPEQIYPLPKDRNWFALRYGLDQVFTVLYSGNMGRCHDIDTILEAALELRDEPVQFVFIGSGPKRKDLMERVKAANLTRCLFLPYQDQDVLPYSLAACDLSLVSLVQGVEGMVAPSKLYGSLAAGCPVAAICEPHSYLRSLLAEGAFGEAFDNGDGVGLAGFIRRLMANPDMGRQMGDRGRQFLLENFTPQHCAQAYLEVVLRCLHQDPGGSTAPLPPELNLAGLPGNGEKASETVYPATTLATQPTPHYDGQSYAVHEIASPNADTTPLPCTGASHYLPKLSC
jgi:glycosyltransferase involved in cell wall biosynthesis